MSDDRVRSEGSELSEPTEVDEPHETSSAGALLRSLIGATHPPLLQKAVARHLGVSPGTVSDWLRDRHAPRWDHVDLLEQLLIDHGVELERGLLAERVRVLARDDERHTLTTAAVNAHAPVPLTPLVGRDDEVDQLMSLWNQHRLVCITGPAGVGKTRLAAAVSDRIDEKSPHEVVWLRVASAGAVDELYQLISLALHARTSVTTSMLSSIARAIGTQPRTIVLDNVDKIEDEGHRGMVFLLERCAELRILVTARRGLHVPGATQFRVHPLAVPDENVDEDDARRYPAMQLFAALAMQAGTGYAVTQGNVQQVGGICRALGGLPFCLELAAAQLDTITLHELHHQLTGGGQVGMQFRAPTADDAVLHAALGSSWNMLSSVAQRTLACSSVFSGSFDADRAARLIALSPSTATSALHELVRSSMVQVDHSKLQSSYHILEPLRNFAAQRLEELDDGHEVRPRHAQHLADLLSAQFPLTHTDAIDRIGWSDLLTALQWSVENDTAASVRIAGNLWPHWLRVGAFATGRSWLTRVIEACPSDHAGTARAVVGAGVLAQREGDASRAASFLADGLRLARDEADARAKHVAVVNLGWLALIDGRGDEAARRAEEVLEGTWPGERGWGVAAGLSLRGTVRMLRDDSGAVGDLEQSLAISTAIGDVSGAISANLQLSRLALRRGDVDRAQYHASAGLADAERINDRSLTGAALVGVGATAKADGRSGDALSLLERAAELMGRSEEPMARCRTLLELARARADIGETGAVDQAVADILAATDIAVEEDVRVLLPLCFETMSEVVSDSDDGRWLKEAATSMRHRIGLAGAESAPSASTEVVSDLPASAALAKFGEIYRSVIDRPSGDNPS